MKNFNKKSEKRLKELQENVKKLTEDLRKIKKVKPKKPKKEYIPQKKKFKWNKKEDTVVNEIIVNFHKEFPEHLKQ